MNKNLQLYNKFFVEKNAERVDLFRKMKAKYNLESAIYPGSFVHIAPSLVFRQTAYIDSDRRVSSFFNDPEVVNFVESKKDYQEKSVIQAFQQDYSKKLPIDVGMFDLMISQYAGFVSQECKQYLKVGGILLANNSHGDSGLAFLDSEYELIAVTDQSDDNWTIKEAGLGEYFVPSKGQHPSASSILKTMKGVGYKKTAANYIFRKISEDQSALIAS